MWLQDVGSVRLVLALGALVFDLLAFLSTGRIEYALIKRIREIRHKLEDQIFDLRIFHDAESLGMGGLVS